MSRAFVKLGRWVPVLALVSFAAGCSDSNLVGPGTTDPVERDGAFGKISDGANGGNEHFYFLSPMVPAPSPAGVFDGSLDPVVEVCQVASMDPDMCGVAFATFTTVAGAGSETVRVSTTDGHYIVNWHSGDFDLDPAKTYRIRVSVNSQELGFADIDVVTTGKEVKNVATGEYIPLVDGRTLPIKFRIEEGALSEFIDPDVIGTGVYHSCAIDAAGYAYCWGHNAYGQLGRGTLSFREILPAPVTGGHTFQSILPSLARTCGVTTAGDAYCWGDNNATPTLVAGGHTWQSIAVSETHTCGLTTGGEAYCWGGNVWGQLGRGTFSHHEAVPAPVTGGHTFTALRAHYRHSCALTTAGDAYCWGQNTYGVLGDGTEHTRHTPTLVMGGLAFESIDAGFHHTCAVTPTGDAYCWGYNGNGGLGTGLAGAPQMNPVAVAGGYAFQSVRTGYLHSCGVTTTGAAYCWGYNKFGQVGNGTTSVVVAAPVAVAGTHTWEFIDAGYRHSCGKTIGGDAYCWGFNQTGQLGDGTITDSSIPVFVALDLTP